jgi:glycosyltransferase involved in cell wall biosynthesis
MRVQVVDPPAYTPPYDRSLCAALAAAGADVELVTSRFLHGPVADLEGFEVTEHFYRDSARRGLGAVGRTSHKAVEHISGMFRLRSRTAGTDVVHYQWLDLAALDWLLLPAQRPRILTTHGTLRGPPPGWAVRRTYGRMDAVVALSEYGAAKLRDQARVPEERVRVIPHGPLDYVSRIPAPAPLPAELNSTDRPVVLFFGIVRPYKGVDVLLDAFRELGHEDAELWVVGRILGIDLADLHARARRASSPVRFVSRFIDDREIPALFERADLVVLPYREAEQSGVLYLALAFGKPIVMSSVGGFPEVAAHGAGRLVPPGDSRELAAAISDLLEEPEERERLAAAAAAAASGPYSWERIADAHLDLYRELLSS